MRATKGGEVKDERIDEVCFAGVVFVYRVYAVMVYSEYAGRRYVNMFAVKKQRGQGKKQRRVKKKIRKTKRRSSGSKPH